jgi:phosphoesterase RecJ-like protein
VSAPRETRRAFHEFVAKHRRLLLTTHINPDGDGLGSEVAVALWLRSMGKTVRILNDSLVPTPFAFLTREQSIESWEPDAAEEALDASDALIVLDTSNRQRIGRLAPQLDQHLLPIAVVDHHTSHANGFGQVNVIEPDASATGEIVYDLMREAEFPLTRTIAEALYVALATDTGWFRYSNTDHHAHRMAAELLPFGLDPQKLHAQVNANKSAGRMRFFGEVLSGLEMLCDGRLVLMEAAPEQFQKHGVVGADTEGLVDEPRNIAGVDIVVLISEVEPGKTKVSLRSTGRVSIDGVASRLGGGGHPHAAGALLRATRAEARARVLPDLERTLSSSEPRTGTTG